MGSLLPRVVWQYAQGSEQCGRAESDILKPYRILPRQKSGIPVHEWRSPQLETFDYKPKLANLLSGDLPPSVRKGQRLTGMSANQAILPVAPLSTNSINMASTIPG